MRLGLSWVDRVSARAPMPLVAVGMTVMAGALVAGCWSDSSVWLGRVGVGVFVLGLTLYVRAGTPRDDVIDLGSPVRGRWRAVNSPTSRVPSHHVHGWSQTYAIDLVHDPPDGAGPALTGEAELPIVGRMLHHLGVSITISVTLSARADLVLP